MPARSRARQSPARVAHRLVDPVLEHLDAVAVGLEEAGLLGREQRVEGAARHPRGAHGVGDRGVRVALLRDRLRHALEQPRALGAGAGVEVRRDGGVGGDERGAHGASYPMGTRWYFAGTPGIKCGRARPCSLPCPSDPSDALTHARRRPPVPHRRRPRDDADLPPGDRPPAFAAFTLYDDDGGPRRAARVLRADYIATAREQGAGFILDTATWRANPDWGAGAGLRRGGDRARQPRRGRVRARAARRRPATRPGRS